MEQKGRGEDATPVQAATSDESPSPEAAWSMLAHEASNDVCCRIKQERAGKTDVVPQEWEHADAGLFTAHCRALSEYFLQRHAAESYLRLLPRSIGSQEAFRKCNRDTNVTMLLVPARSTAPAGQSTARNERTTLGVDAGQGHEDAQEMLFNRALTSGTLSVFFTSLPSLISLSTIGLPNVRNWQFHKLLYFSTTGSAFLTYCSSLLVPFE